MAQLIVTVNDNKMLGSIMRAIELMKGVTAVTKRDESEFLVASYPRLPKDRPISPEVLEMVMDTLPDGVNIGDEFNKMWEDLAQ